MTVRNSLPAALQMSAVAFDYLRLPPLRLLRSVSAMLTETAAILLLMMFTDYGTRGKCLESLYQLLGLRSFLHR